MRTQNLNTHSNIQKIINKYEARPQPIHLDSTHKPWKANSGISTPEFSTIDRKHIIKNLQRQAYDDKTQKKNQYRSREGEVGQYSFAISSIDNSIRNIDYSIRSIDRNDYQTILRKLDDTQDKLARSQKNYGEIWRKYQKLLHENQTSSKEAQLEHRLRVKESDDMNQQLAAVQREALGIKECLAVKEANITALKEKASLNERKVIEMEGELHQTRSELLRLKERQIKSQQQWESRLVQKEKQCSQLTEQIDRYRQAMFLNQKQKKELVLQLQKNYLAHKQQLTVLKKSYLKADQEYTNWIQQCTQQKIKMTCDYQAKIKQAQQSINSAAATSPLALQLNQKDEQINQLMSINMQLNLQIKQLKIQGQRLGRTKSELVHKVSVLQNSIIDKNDKIRQLQETCEELREAYKISQDRNKQTSAKYWEMNAQFLEIKGKCGAMFNQLQQRNVGSNKETQELVDVRKQLINCKKELQLIKSKEFTMNSQLTDSISVLKNTLATLQEQNSQMNTQLLAQRLQNARLKQQLAQTQSGLKRQYELSLQNTKRQLQQQIAKSQVKGYRGQENSQSKENLYLQLRELQKKYELLANQIVTVDEVMGIANKIEKRNKAYSRR